MNFSICENNEFRTEHEGKTYVCYITSFIGPIFHDRVFILHIGEVIPSKFLIWTTETKDYFHKYYFSSEVKYDSWKYMGGSLWYDVDFVKSLIPLALSDYKRKQANAEKDQKEFDNAEHMTFI